MYGYIFETTNTKTGEKYLGKRYAVSFDKKYLGEDADRKLSLDIEKYGRIYFEAKMIMPYETQAALDEAFNAMQKSVKKPVVKKEEKPVVKAEPKVEEPKEEKEEPVKEVKAPAKRGRKKTVEA